MAWYARSMPPLCQGLAQPSTASLSGSRFGSRASLSWGVSLGLYSVCPFAGMSLPANPMPRWVPMANVDSSAMFIAFLAWYRQPSSRRVFYAMRMDAIMTQIDHGAIGPLTDTEWFEDHYVPIRKVLCDGILCKRCRDHGGNSILPNGYIFRWFSPFWESVYMSFRNPNLNSWVPADGYDYDSADGARYRGNVARDQHGTCLVPRSRWAEVAAIMGIEPPDGVDYALDLILVDALEEALDPVYEQADADESQI